jgi:alanyl-tRNA synthetase
LVKILGIQSYKGGTRISILAGQKALLDYARKNRAVAEIGGMLSAKQEEAVEAVKRLIDSNAKLKEKIFAQKRKEDEAKASAIPQGTKLATLFEEDAAPDDLRLLSIAVSKRADIAAVFAKDGDGYKYAISSLKTDVRKLVAEMNAALKGRGGGKSELAQGSVQADRAMIQNFLLGYL